MRQVLLLATCVFLATVSGWIYCQQEVSATGDAFSDTKHGGAADVDGSGTSPCAGGVHRRIADGGCDTSDKYLDAESAYAPGECGHCHEIHESFGGEEPDPKEPGGPHLYLTFQDSQSEKTSADFCLFCHDAIDFTAILNYSGLGDPPAGFGVHGVFQNGTDKVFENSGHYLSFNFLWPKPDSDPSPTIHPRRARSTAKGTCLNCHTPHGIKGAAGATYDTEAVPVNIQDKSTPTVGDITTPYLIPRQKIAWEEALCENCHDATGTAGGPAPNIKDEIDKRSTGGSGHPVDDTQYAGQHSTGEAVEVTVKHVECYDCHNPHAVKSGGRMAGAKYVEINGTTRIAGVGEAREPYVYEVCLRCHGEKFATFIPAKTVGGQPIRTTAGNPASGNTHGSNKRVEFNPASTGAQTPVEDNPSTGQNTAYHPVGAPGTNTSDALRRQLLGGLTPESTINCTDCHNNDDTGTTSGPVTESNLRATDVISTYVATNFTPVGPHGSKPPAVSGYQTYRILRANYNTTLEGAVAGDAPFSSFDSNNFALCFLCHNQEAFELQCGEPYNDCDTWKVGGVIEPKTNFYSIYYSANLHASHLAGKPVISATGTFTTCANCHYNVHSNVEAANTKYASNDNWWNRTTDGGTRLINYSPIVGPNSSYNYGKPTWGCADFLGEWRKGCNFNCHGFDQELYYTPVNNATTCNY